MANTWAEAAALLGSFTLRVRHAPRGYEVDTSWRRWTATRRQGPGATSPTGGHLRQRRPGDHRRLDQHGLQAGNEAQRRPLPAGASMPHDGRPGLMPCSCTACPRTAAGSHGRGSSTYRDRGLGRARNHTMQKALMEYPAAGPPGGTDCLNSAAGRAAALGVPGGFLRCTDAVARRPAPTRWPRPCASSAACAAPIPIPPLRRWAGRIGGIRVDLRDLQMASSPCREFRAGSARLPAGAPRHHRTEADDDQGTGIE